MVNYAQRVEDSLELETQTRALQDMEEAGISIQYTGPPKRWDTVYSMQTGEPITVAHHRVRHILSKRLPDGSAAFTARLENAPTYRQGTTRCFLADDSDERMSGLLEEAGLADIPPCIAKKLRSPTAKRQHGEHKHPHSWLTLQEFLRDRRERQRDEQTRQQTEAMLAMAGQRSEEAPKRGRTPKESGD